MKYFIKKIILFSIIPLVVIFSFDMYLRNINTLYKAKYNGLMEKKKDIEVLILGNSHACYAINPKYFKDFETYNLANVSQQIYFDKRLTEKAINEGVSSLKYVLISVDYHSLFTSSQGIRNVWSFYANGVKYKDQNYTKEIISPFLWGYTPKVAISLLKKDILRHIKNPGSKIDFEVENGISKEDSLYNGFIGFSGSDSNSFTSKNYEEKASEFKENKISSERKEVTKDLEEFIIFLKSKNITPILFSSPTFQDYNSFLDQKQIQRNLQNIDLLCKKFELEYWRFNEDNQFLKEDFYNQDHLNKKGTKKFSVILNQKLKESQNL